MNDMRDFDRAVARWLDVGSDVTRPEVIESVLLAVRTTRQERDPRSLLTTSPIAIYMGLAAFLAIVVVAGVSALYAVGLGPNVGFPSGDPPSPFEGTWVSTRDADGGTQTMNVRVSGEGAVDITVHDTIASVCSGTPSAMTGTGAIEGGTRLVIPAPVYTCDDGSQPQALGGPPLDEQLGNWTLALDPQTGTLTDSVGGVWYREGAAVPSPDSSSPPSISGQMWPQTSLEEVREAQELADAGDPDYTWQVDPVLASFGGPDANGEPLEAEIFERFIREELGWEAFNGFAIHGYVEGGGHLEGVLFIRCAPGRTNPLYPEVYPEMPPEVRGCAPTIDDSRYETVRFNVEQEGRVGPSGIWVVTGWEMLQAAEPGSLYEHLYPEFDQRPVAQAAPPSDVEVTAVLEAFLEARVDGEAAEQYLHRHGDEGWGDEEVPLLYATTGGTPYDRSEIERVQGPVWPNGWTEYKVRLFAGETVVEQSFVVVRDENGRLGLVYGSQTGDPPIPTTENGQAVPVPYRLLDGEVTFAAAPPWGDTILDRTFTVLGGVGRGSASQFTMFAIVADPRTGVGCEAGPAPADAEALVRSIRSNPDLEATDPVAVSVGGIDALLMDVVAPGQLEVGDCMPIVLEPLSLGQDGRMRLYLLDLPDGMSARILAIAISALDSEFERVVEAAAPIMGSFEFHAE